jgi:hypothetical protein
LGLVFLEQLELGGLRQRKGGAADGGDPKPAFEHGYTSFGARFVQNCTPFAEIRLLAVSNALVLWMGF